MDPSPTARRQAIEARLNQLARARHVDVNRLRRALVFERLLVRLESGEAGAWVQAVPGEIPDPPPAWARTYVDLATAADLRARTFPDALLRLREFWADALRSADEGPHP